MHAVDLLLLRPDLVHLFDVQAFERQIELPVGFMDFFKHLVICHHDSVRIAFWYKLYYNFGSKLNFVKLSWTSFNRLSKPTWKKFPLLRIRFFKRWRKSPGGGISRLWAP